MRLTESVHVAIQNVSAHESDKYSKERRHYRRVFLKKDMAERWATSEKELVFRICHRGVKHAVQHYYQQSK